MTEHNDNMTEPDLDLGRRMAMPFRTVAAMATAGVRSRLGRSAVTLFGVANADAWFIH